MLLPNVRIITKRLKDIFSHGQFKKYLILKYFYKSNEYYIFLIFLNNNAFYAWKRVCSYPTDLRLDTYQALCMFRKMSRKHCANAWCKMQDHQSTIGRIFKFFNPSIKLRTVSNNLKKL